MCMEEKNNQFCIELVDWIIFTNVTRFSSPNKFFHFFKKKKGICGKFPPLVLTDFAKILEILFQ